MKTQKEKKLGQSNSFSLDQLRNLCLVVVQYERKYEKLATAKGKL